MAETRGEIRDRWSYDVFISFRGTDVRKNLVSYLYESLVRSGIYVFKDDKELKPGDSISPDLLKAIDNSKIHLVILSVNYVSSSWCLDELVRIIQCKARHTEQIIIPIFHYVEPADVRYLKGSFGKSFDKHKSRYPEERLEEWKNALYECSTIAGLQSANWEGFTGLINKVTKDILKRLPSSYLHLPKYGVGIKSRAHRIYELMRFGSNDVQIIGIWGMGGIGKTTLAKAAYNEYSQRFEGRSFIENFGEYSKKPEGKVHIQQKLLSDILRRDDLVFNNMDHAVKHRFRNKRVLVVIDDVKDLTLIKSIAIDSSYFGPGSRIIITCRNKHLLKQLGVRKIYSPKELDGGESLELLSWHAFKTNKPPKEFLHLSEKLGDYCGGLPLAMEVLGASLCSRSIPEWENTLELLKQTPDADIKAKLQISYDSLSLVQKEIFLHISCFFIGMDKDYVSCILNGCKLFPEIGLTVLKERCLITVRDNKLMMHDLLRDMGRQIIQETFPKNCEKWSRLWDCDNVLDVLTNNSGTDVTEGLSLNAEVMPVQKLEVEAFSTLRRLQLLQLSNVSLNGSYEHFPKDLRWFCWFKFPLASVPTNLHLENLVVMDLQYSNLKRIWDDRDVKPPFLKKLKYLDLSHSVQLTDTPDFSYLPNLEKLLLIDCKSLVRVHNSIGTLQQKLLLLNLKGCSELGDLPLELYTLKSLETLILSECSQLERLDDALGEIKSLKILKVDNTALTQIPSSTDQLENLEELSLDGCKELRKNRDSNHSDESLQAALPISLSLNGLRSLKTLRLGSCSLSDELVPLNLGSLSSLEELDLRGNNFRYLQMDFAGLSSLQILKLDGCSELESMYSVPKKLRSLYARNCIMLKTIPDLSNCSVLQSLHLTNCSNLDATPGLDKLKTVGVIHMEMCNNIPESYRERIMQGWAVGSSGEVFIPGSRLPDWVNFKNKTHSISFTVPQTLNVVLVGFVLWTSYVSQHNDVKSKYSPKITMKNKTKGIVCSRNPAEDGIRMYRKKHIWQGHFSNEDFFLETGDQVQLSVDFGDQVTILETGITLTYRDEVIDIPNKQFLQIEQEDDDELIREENHAYRDEVIDIPNELQKEQEDDTELIKEENQRTHCSKMGTGFKRLLARLVCWH